MRLSIYQIVGVCISILFFLYMLIPIIQNFNNERITLRGVIDGSPKYNQMIEGRYGNYSDSCIGIGNDLNLCSPKKIIEEEDTIKITYGVFKKDYYLWPGRYLYDITIAHPILKENEIFVLLEAVAGLFGLPFYIASFAYLTCKKGFVNRSSKIKSSISKCQESTAGFLAIFALFAGEFSFLLIFSHYDIIAMIDLRVIPLILGILYSFYIGFLGWWNLEEEPLRFDEKTRKNIGNLFIFCGVMLPIIFLWFATIHTPNIPNYQLETFSLITVAVLFQIIQLVFNLYFILSRKNEMV